MIACNVAGNNEAETGSQTGITATEIPKKATTDVRDSYVLLSISSLEDKTNYHLAVKEKGKPAPTATEMTEGALKRHLSTNAINVLIAQRLNAPMISYAKDTDPGKTLGTGMTDNQGIILDSAKDQTDTWIAATGANAWVAESVLKPSTQYTLYGMESNGTTVKKLLDFSTDATAVTSNYPAEDAVTMVDTTLAGTNYDIALHADEYYIFPMQTQFKPVRGGDFSFMNLVVDGVIAIAIDVRDRNLFAGSAPSDMLFLVKNISSASNSEIFQKGSYLLLITSNRQNDFWQQSCTVRVNNGVIGPSTPSYQKLVIQR